MRQFFSAPVPDDSATRVAYRVSKPGSDPSLHGVWRPRSNDLSAEPPDSPPTTAARAFYRIVDWDNRMAASEVLAEAEAEWADDPAALLSWPTVQAVPA